MGMWSVVLFYNFSATLCSQLLKCEVIKLTKHEHQLIDLKVAIQIFLSWSYFLNKGTIRMDGSWAGLFLTFKGMKLKLGKEKRNPL